MDMYWMRSPVDFAEEEWLEKREHMQRWLGRLTSAFFILLIIWFVALTASITIIENVELQPASNHVFGPWTVFLWIVAFYAKQTANLSLLAAIVILALRLFRGFLWKRHQIKFYEHYFLEDDPGDEPEDCQDADGAHATAHENGAEEK